MRNNATSRFVTVGDYLERIPRQRLIKKSEYRSSGPIPVIDQGTDFIAGYTDDENRTYNGPLPVIVFGDHTRILKYVPFRFAVGAEGTQLIRPTKEFDIRYFFYCLRNVNLKNYGYERHFKYLKEEEIVLRSLPSQGKIAAILSAYDDLIENNTRRIEILEKIAQTLYREWFVKFRFPEHEDVKMIDSELGFIPEGWDVSTLGDVCHIVMGQSPKSEFYNTNGDGLPFHQGVTDFGTLFPTDRIYCTVQNRVAEKGDILFSVRAPVGRINIANKRMVIGRGLSAIRSQSGQQWFVFHQLKEKFREEDTMGGGTVFNAVTKQDMHRIKVIVPQQSMLEQFEEVVRPVFSQLETLTDTNDNLRRTRDLLLPRLISGELDVEDLDIDTEGLVQ